jgi:hypothetical protein
MTNLSQADVYAMFRYKKAASDELMKFAIRWVIGEHNAASPQPKKPGNNYWGFLFVLSGTWSSGARSIVTSNILL